jgi:isopentenyl-diphosphate Delta-isomerase
MAELLQIYSKDGEPLDRGVSKDQVHEHGLWFGGAHLWLWTKANDSIEVLVQQRAAHKSWGGRLDVTAAGHVLFGESPEQAAARELREELGISIGANRLELLQQTRDTALLEGGRTKNEHRWIFLAELTHKPQLILEPSEVAAAHWLPLAELTTIIGTDRFTDRGQDYYRKVCEVMEAKAKSN